MWLGWWPNPSTDSLVWLQEMAKSGSIDIISKTLNWGYPCRFLGMSLAIGFYFTPKCYLFNYFFQLSLLTTIHMTLPVPSPEQYNLKIYFNDIQEPSSYLASFHLWIITQIFFTLQQISHCKWIYTMSIFWGLCYLTWAYFFLVPLIFYKYYNTIFSTVEWVHCEIYHILKSILQLWDI